MLKPSLFNKSDAYIVLNATITVANIAAENVVANNTNI